MTTLLVLTPLVLPVAAALIYGVAGWRPSTRWLGAVGAAAGLAAAIVTAVKVGHGTPWEMAGLLRVDPLSAFMLIVITAVALLATAAIPDHLGTEIAAGRVNAHIATRHCVLVQLFLAAMALAVLAANLGLLWVAVEATTVVTAFLVGQSHSRAATEAAWKYVVICSTGIALALLGALLLNFASRHTDTGAGLDLADLAVAATSLDPDVTRIAIVLLIVGFGTKAGLAPLHAWLPDAHSQAPAPVSALMSGVLLSVAFYAILRVKVIADAALGVEFARTLLIVIALASLVVAASLLIAQHDYKRMLAYSSIEHMSLLAFGAAIGGRLAIAAALLHVLGHGLVKGVLFLGAGNVLQLTRTSRIDGVRGLIAREPVLAGCFAVGTLALVGLPPFSLFTSELGIARAGFDAGLGWSMATAFVLVLVIAAVLMAHVSRMVLGAAPEGPGSAMAVRRMPKRSAAVLVTGLIASAVVGMYAGPLTDLIYLAADTLVEKP